jgi:hypothetical protein
MGESRPNGLAAALERAQTISERFSKVTQAVNDRLREVQTALVGLRLGVRGVVELPLPGDEPEWRRYLVFAKINGEWILFIESGADDSRADWTITPLLNASREVRLAAVDVLPFLVEDMVDSAESALAESEGKAKALDEFLSVTRSREPDAAYGFYTGADQVGSVKVTSNLPPDVAKSIELPERPMENLFAGTKKRRVDP